MPTASERAGGEAERWQGIAARWAPDHVPDLYAELAPSEHDVVVFFDPRDDLERRASGWGFSLERPHLDVLGRFAAGLAVAERAAWHDDVPDIAMRAYDSRRLLIGERIAHWAVPWLDAVGRRYPDRAEAATTDRDIILELLDELRIAPAETGSEGLVVPGEDAYGPLEIDVPLQRRLRSLWSGVVLLGIAIDTAPVENLQSAYEAAADGWRRLASGHHGSARLWLDLAARAERTASEIRPAPR